MLLGQNDDGDGSSMPSPSKRNKIFVSGFCRSVAEYRDDPYKNIAVVQEMLRTVMDRKNDSTGRSLRCFSHALPVLLLFMPECVLYNSTPATNLRTEAIQTITDAVMLLNEILFSVNERTLIVDAPSGKELVSHRKEDGNKNGIIDLAKERGLSTPQISALLATLIPRDGYYSIDVAVAIIGPVHGKDRARSVDVGFDDEACGYRRSVLADPNAKPLALLGSRVRTVFEDGKEYEGTITHNHTRVVYDDGQTATFDSEAELFENLACNDMVLRSSSFDVLRCKALELFSGESVRYAS